MIDDVIAAVAGLGALIIVLCLIAIGIALTVRALEAIL